MLCYCSIFITYKEQICYFTKYRFYITVANLLQNCYNNILELLQNSYRFLACNFQYLSILKHVTFDSVEVTKL